MKTKILIPLLTLAGLLAVPATAQVNYAVSGGTAYVTNSPNASNNVVIASTYNGYPVTSIEGFAFGSCTNLTSVTIPNSVTDIGSWAFPRSSNLTNLSVDAANSVYSSLNGVLFNKAQTTLIQFPGGRGGSYDIPNGVTSIGHEAFYNCTSLTSVTIPDGVTNIGHQAFGFCTSLTSVTVPNSVTSIWLGAFTSCTGLTSVTIPDSVTSIGSYVFSQCTSLTSVTIPSSVASIEGAAFSYCRSLANLTIPNSVTNLDFSAFFHCTSLTNVTIGNSVTKIGDSAFSDCTSLTSVAIPNSVTLIEYRAFYGCTGLTCVTLGNSVTNIDEQSFYGCTSLTNFTVDLANPSYSSLNGVLFNAKQTALKRFPGGRGGGYLIPNSVTSIVDLAFSGCISLTSVTIPDRVTTIGESAFFYCTSLTNMTVAANNPFYSSLNGVLFNKAHTTLIQFPGGGGGGYLIPNSVTSINDSAFSYCTRLTNVTIPSSVTSIEGGAFSYCTSLTNVTFGNSVTNIGNWAFFDCTSLTKLTFLGNSPYLDSGGRPPYSSFAFDNIGAGATVYYYYGTTGWGPTYGGLPTVMLGAPAPQVGSGSAGVKPGGFGFTITGVVHQTIVVEASIDLANWHPIWTNTLSAASASFVDPQWLNHPRRFYRLRSPQ